MTLHLLRLAIPRAALAAAEEAILDLGGALWADTKDSPEPVPLELTLPPGITADRLSAALAPLAETFGFALPALKLEPLADRDWVAESQRQLPPQTAGRFWIHGSHVTDAPPPGLVPLQVEASIAFGTGRHETTQGCLIAMDELARRRSVERVLDLGTGSGLLAMAAAVLWPAASIRAVDIDRPSIAVARENAELNGLALHISFGESDGFAAVRGSFDLILANILAEPLVQLAPELVEHLAPGGLAILSGLLSKQSREVLRAYEAEGLRLVETRTHGDWDTLTFQR
ncbi:MAG TPA: 50S ribosomal protein L11 methyltransferase [Kiloniellales bacterium]|nr:50S ribosomal protein L11 methyltransferase [Kiloniellales bacterium]